MLTIHVTGTPAPQGSKRGFYNPKIGRVQMVESSSKVKPWRQDVKAAALNTIATVDHQQLLGPVAVDVVFYLPRPAGHYGTGRNAHQIKGSSPRWPHRKPDVDKLQRSTLDALGEAGVWRDDAQVVDVHASKAYADGRPPGADITIRSLDAEPAAPAVPVGGQEAMF